MSRLIRVSVSDRAIIFVGDKLLFNIDLSGRELKRKELWPFGGGVSVSPQKIRKLTVAFEACDFEGYENDLRFKLPRDTLPGFRVWLKRNLPKSSEDLRRELVEEAGQYNIPPKLFSCLPLKSRPKRMIENERNDWSYLTSPVREVWSVCFDRIFVTRAPGSTVKAFQRLALSGTDVDLVSPQEIRRGKSSRGNTIPLGCKVLLR